MNTTTPQKLQLIRIDEVMRLTGLSRTSIYERASSGRFPKPLKISRRYSPWNAAEVQDWINSQIAQHAPSHD